MKVRDLLFSNFRRKLFALLLAIIVWTTVTVIMRRQLDEQRPVPAYMSPPIVP